MGIVTIIILLAVGIALIVLELVAIPGTTICGIAGIGLTIWGLIELYGNYGAITGGIVTLCEIVLFAFLLIKALKAKVWERFAQKHEIDSSVNNVSTPIEIGTKGIAVTRLAPRGTAMLNNEKIEVISPTQFIDPNTNIVVTNIEGNKIEVKCCE